jgi:MFS family permease
MYFFNGNLQMKEISPELEFKLLQRLFFVYAILIMAWVPRFPEVKANLGLSNGQFGSLISTAAIGALGSLFLTGHIVHQFGTKIVLQVNALIMCISYFAIVETRSPALFLIFNIAIGWGIYGYHIAINAQSFDAMNRVHGLTITRLHGIWALGALTTAVISGLIVEFVGLSLHVGGLAVITGVIIFASLNRLTPVMLKANEDAEEHLPFSSLFLSFKIDWLVSGGLVSAIFLEFATGDWSAIFTKERIGVSASLASLPYILFMATMISGRLGANRITKVLHIHHAVRFLAITGGAGFLLFLTIAVQIPSEHKNWALLATCLAFIFAGGGTSLLAPSFLAAGDRRSPLPSAVVVGQLAFLNNIAIFILKTTIAWVAQFTGSLAIALAIPGALLISAAYFARAVKED